MNALVLWMLAWGISLAMLLLVVKLLVWGLAGAGLVLPFWPVFAVAFAIRLLLPSSRA